MCSLSGAAGAAGTDTVNTCGAFKSVYCLESLRGPLKCPTIRIARIKLRSKWVLNRTGIGTRSAAGAARPGQTRKGWVTGTVTVSGPSWSVPGSVRNALAQALQSRPLRLLASLKQTGGNPEAQLNWKGFTFRAHP